MEPSGTEWKAAAKCAWDGTPPDTLYSAGHCCGSIRRHGPGLECEAVLKKISNYLAPIVLLLALPLAGCSEKGAESAAAAPAPTVTAPSPEPNSASAPGSGFTVS